MFLYDWVLRVRRWKLNSPSPIRVRIQCSSAARLYRLHREWNKEAKIKLWPVSFWAISPDFGTLTLWPVVSDFCDLFNFQSKIPQRIPPILFTTQYVNHIRSHCLVHACCHSSSGLQTAQYIDVNIYGLNVIHVQTPIWHIHLAINGPVKQSHHRGIVPLL